jgi:hypothetical protein
MTLTPTNENISFKIKQKKANVFGLNYQLDWGCHVGGVRMDYYQIRSRFLRVGDEGVELTDLTFTLFSKLPNCPNVFWGWVTYFLKPLKHPKKQTANEQREADFITPAVCHF